MKFQLNRMSLNVLQKYIFHLFQSRLTLGVVLVVTCFVTMYLLHGKVMIAPNDYMLSNEGEAARVYYVMASHAKSDSSYTNFQGMNYPYGEHIIYCDGQPLLTNSFKFISSLFPGAINYAVAVQNILSLYAFILGALLLYIFLVRWSLPPWYSALVAFALMLLAPQVLRLPWHYPLAYTCFIPLILILYQQYFRSRTWKWAFIIFLVNLSGFFINVYLGVIGSGFFAVACLAMLVWEGWRKIEYYLQSILLIIVPGVMFFLYKNVTDFRIDRVETPTGFHGFTSTIGSLFTSPFSPVKSLYESIGVDMKEVFRHFEGMSYIGLSCTLLLVFFIIIGIYRIVRRKLGRTHMHKEQKTVLLIGIIFMILSMGYPFIIHNKIIEFFSPVKQLRALGRLAWVFTYCINILMLYLFYHWINSRTTQIWKRVGYTVVVLLLSFTVYEGIKLHQWVFPKQVQSNPFINEKLDKDPVVGYLSEAIAAIDSERYSAIVPIPYFHWGSELFLTASSSSYHAELEVFTFAYHTELPITACFTSRNSRKESIRALQFFAPEMIEKEIAEDIPPDLHLLLFYSKSVPLPTSKDELRLLDLGKVVYETEQIKLVEVIPERIWKTNNEEIISRFNDSINSYNCAGNIYYRHSEPPVYLSFDDHQQTTAISGGALEGEANTPLYIFDQQKDAPKIGLGKYELSFWIETSKNRAQAKLMLEIVDKDGKVISTNHLWKAKKTSTYWKNWMRWSIPIEITKEHAVKLYVEQPYDQPGVFVDELMLLPQNSDVFVNTMNGWFWNNYILKRIGTTDL